MRLFVKVAVPESQRNHIKSTEFANHLANDTHCNHRGTSVGCQVAKSIIARLKNRRPRSSSIEPHLRNRHDAYPTSMSPRRNHESMRKGPIKTVTTSVKNWDGM